MILIMITITVLVLLIYLLGFVQFVNIINNYLLWVACQLNPITQLTPRPTTIRNLH